MCGTAEVWVFSDVASYLFTSKLIKDGLLAWNVFGSHLNEKFKAVSFPRIVPPYLIKCHISSYLLPQVTVSCSLLSLTVLSCWGGQQRQRHVIRELQKVPSVKKAPDAEAQGTSCTLKPPATSGPYDTSSQKNAHEHCISLQYLSLFIKSLHLDGSFILYHCPNYLCDHCVITW